MEFLWLIFINGVVVLTGAVLDLSLSRRYFDSIEGRTAHRVCKTIKQAFS